MKRIGLLAILLSLCLCDARAASQYQVIMNQVVTCPIGCPYTPTPLGTPFLLRVQVLGTDAVPALGYRSTLVFTSSDKTATLIPSSYTFTAADNGVTDVVVQINDPGNTPSSDPNVLLQTIFATDVANDLQGSYDVGISAARPPVTIARTTDLTGAWYDSTVGGQGLLFDMAPNPDGSSTVAGAWFTFTSITYSNSAYPLWFSLQGNIAAGAAYAPVNFYESSHGSFAEPPAVLAQLVGRGLLSFKDCTHATLYYGIIGALFMSPVDPPPLQYDGSIPLVRLSQDGGCALPAPPAKSSRGFSGTWYNAATSGQGLIFDIGGTNGGTFFGGWFTFTQRPDFVGTSPAWYTLQGAFATDATEADVGVYVAKTEPFRSTQALPQGDESATREVGTAHIRFMSCTQAQLDYSVTFKGMATQTGTISLTRLTSVPDDCPL